jgi:hypothetical protein
MPYNPYNNNTQFGGDLKGAGDWLSANGGQNPYWGSGGGGGNGAAQAAQSGVAALTGAVEMGVGIKGRIDEFRNMNVNVQGQTFDEGYKPQYNIGSDITKLNNLMGMKDEVGKGMIGGNVAKGAMTGLAAGSATGNPLGMAIGTAAGAVGGLFAGIFGKKKTREEYDDKVSELQTNVTRRQGQFNTANKAYYDNQDARGIYNIHQERKQNRMYNIPSFNSL